ncbi:MAG: hypothetical protein AAF990_25280 [Bacteroidota bacterium]
MIALKSIDKRSLIDFEDLLFMLVEKEGDAQLDQFYYVDAVIINSIDGEVFDKLLTGIRNHHNPNVYLKPVFAVQQKELSALFTQCCDDTTDLVQYQHIAKKTREINGRVEKLFQLQRFPSPEMEFLYKTLQYIYTRDEKLQPIPHRHSKINYHIPFLSRQIKDRDAQQALRILDLAQRQGYLSPEPVDKVHLCSNCSSAHHTIREACTSCGSIDLSTEDLIHHFQCAYVGPESDFYENKYTDQMTCPKCSKHVRHIGIDYDKPSQIYTCNTCNHHFQEARFTYHCIDCGEVKEVQHLQERAINQMTLTSKGTQLVLKGLPRANRSTSSGADATDIEGFYIYDVFKHLIKQEALRSQRNGNPSVLGAVNLPEEKINRLSSHELVNVQDELCRVLKSYVRETDMISSSSPSHYHFLLTDTDIQRARELKQTIEYNFKQLLDGNFEDVTFEVEVVLQVLGENQANLPEQEMN